MTRLLCTGDLHLGAGADLGRQPGDRLRDQHDVLEQIAHLANERDVDAVLIAGDIFEGPGIPPEQLEVFADFVDYLRSVGVPAVACLGNGRHDAAARATNGLAIFRHIPGIRVSSTPELIDVADVTVATLPWVHPGRYVANHAADTDRDDVNSVVADLLLEAARGLRAQIPEGRTAILIAHWSIDCASLPNGLPVADLREPVLSWDALDSLGFDAIVAAHIHAPQILGSDDSATCGFYVSSPLPLNFGETGDDHGVWILELGDEVFGGVEYEFVPIESRALVTLDLDADGLDAALNADVDEAVVRLRYRATAEQARTIDNAQLRSMLLAAGARVVRIEPEIVREDRARVEGVDESLDPLQALDLYIDANAVEPVLAVRMRERMSHYLNLVPA